jgi:hypothetical protein
MEFMIIVVLHSLHDHLKCSLKFLNGLSLGVHVVDVDHPVIVARVLRSDPIDLVISPENILVLFSHSFILIEVREYSINLIEHPVLMLRRK